VYSLADVLDDRLSDSTKYLLHRRYAVVVAVFIAVALGGVYVGYTAHTTTETTVTQNVKATWTTSSSFEHSAAVQRDASVFDQGVVLQDRTLYFTRVSPVLNGTYRLRHGGDGVQPATARADITLMIRAVGNDDGRTVEYWTSIEDSRSAEAEQLQPGESLSVNFSADVPELLESINEIQTDLGATPGQVQVLVSATSAMETRVAGENFSEARNETLVIKPGAGTYSVAPRTDGRRSYPSTETVVNEVEPSFLEAYVSFIVAFVCLFGASATFVARRQGVFDLPTETVERLESDKERDEFDDWISRGSVSRFDADGEVRLDSLEDIVDVAIDSNRRVTQVEDGRYVVMVDGVRYVYESEN